MRVGGVCGYGEGMFLLGAECRMQGGGFGGNWARCGGLECGGEGWGGVLCGRVTDAEVKTTASINSALRNFLVVSFFD